MFDHATTQNADGYGLKNSKISNVNDYGLKKFQQNFSAPFNEQAVRQGYFRAAANPLSVTELLAGVNNDTAATPQNAAETVFISENVIPPAATENAPQGAQQAAGATQTATAVMDKPAANKSLYKSRDTRGGWGKKYGTAMEAVNDAIKAVNPQLSAAMEQEVYGGATNTPITNAIIAAQEDVRQSSISPMQAAEYISNIYNSNGVDGLNTIFNPKTGNLYDFALSEAKQISASPVKPIPTDGLGAADKGFATTPYTEWMNNTDEGGFHPISDTAAQDAPTEIVQPVQPAVSAE